MELHFSIDLFQTITLNPLVRRLCDILWPINPKPMNPIGDDCIFSKSLCSRNKQFYIWYYLLVQQLKILRRQPPDIF